MPFPTVIDDDGTGTTGTVLDKAFFDAYNAEIAARDNSRQGVYNGAGGTQDVPLPAAAQIRILNLIPTSALTIRGFTGAATQGDLLIVRNASAYVISLQHNTSPGGGVVGLFHVATSAPTPLGVGGAATYFYDGSLWVLIAHEQGAWITAPFNAANFSASGSMTWTVEAGDITALAYRLSGRMLTLAVQLQTTTVGGTASNALGIAAAAYGGFVATKAVSNPMLLNDAVAGWGFGYLNTGAGGTSLSCLRIPGNNWNVGSNLTYIHGQITFEVN